MLEGTSKLGGVRGSHGIEMLVWREMEGSYGIQKIWDVEYRQRPVKPKPAESKVLLHSLNSRISDIRSTYFH
jgi:hypothetical protein